MSDFFIWSLWKYIAFPHVLLSFLFPAIWFSKFIHDWVAFQVNITALNPFHVQCICFPTKNHLWLTNVLRFFGRQINYLYILVFSNRLLPTLCNAPEFVDWSSWYIFTPKGSWNLSMAGSYIVFCNWISFSFIAVNYCMNHLSGFSE